MAGVLKNVFGGSAPSAPAKPEDGKPMPVPFFLNAVVEVDCHRIVTLLVHDVLV
jgi:hypothetical protein